MADFLERMRRASADRVRRARAEVSTAELDRLAAAAPPVVPFRPHPGGFDLIAEVKRRSPSAGALSRSDDGSGAAARRAAGYAEAGAAAVSVLTEPKAFDGSLEDLRAVAAAVRQVPVMRKDFLVDPYQVLEARAAGASGVLLIVRLSDDGALAELLAAAAAARMFVLAEAFDRRDLERLAALEPPAGSRLLAGLNCRDLTSLAVAPARFEALAGAFPPGLPRVAESGLERPAEVGVVAAAGYDLALVGGALMRSEDPRATIEAMLREGRRRKRSPCASG